MYINLHLSGIASSRVCIPLEAELSLIKYI